MRAKFLALSTAYRISLIHLLLINKYRTEVEWNIESGTLRPFVLVFHGSISSVLKADNIFVICAICDNGKSIVIAGRV